MSEATSSRWVDRLFARLQVRYGSAWTAKWAGIEPDAVKADWQDVLGSVFARNPQAIVYGLDHLPEFPPNSGAFLAICMGYRSPMEQLPGPKSKPDPAMVSAVSAVLQKPDGYDPARECADNLRARKERSGGKLEPAQRAQLEALEAIGK